MAKLLDPPHDNKALKVGAQKSPLIKGVPLYQHVYKVFRSYICFETKGSDV